MDNRNRGFTLAEIIIVLGILSTLFILVVSAINIPRQFSLAADVKKKSELEALKQAVVQYYSDRKSFPTVSQWESSVCDTSVPDFLKTYLTKFPCDPSTGKPYYFEPVDTEGYKCDGNAVSCAGFRLLTNLENNKDGAIKQVGCDENFGCGIKDSSGNYFNYGVSLNSPVAKQCKAEGAECEVNNSEKNCCSQLICYPYNPSSNIGKCGKIILPTSTSVSVTPTPDPTSIPPPSPTKAVCGILPDPTVTPAPFTSYPWYANIGIPGEKDSWIIDYNLFLIINALEWYKLENGHYPKCNDCEDWVTADSCLRSTLSKYIATVSFRPTPYPNDTHFYKGETPSGNPYMYIRFTNPETKQDDYCLGVKAVNSNVETVNFNCPVSPPDASYKLFRKGKGSIIDFKPYYGNVWSVYPLEEQERRDSQRKQDLNIFANALGAYKRDFGKYPQIPPRYEDPVVSGIYNLSSFKSILYPQYTPVWPVDPSGNENLYSMFLYNKSGDGIFQNYCIISFMDKNSNCENRCGIPDFRFYYHIRSHSACYGISNPI